MWCCAGTHTRQVTVLVAHRTNGGVAESRDGDLLGGHRVLPRLRPSKPENDAMPSRGYVCPGRMPRRVEVAGRSGCEVRNPEVGVEGKADGEGECVEVSRLADMEHDAQVTQCNRRSAIVCRSDGVDETAQGHREGARA